MGRGKLAMELIEKEKSRVKTFQKRKKGLIKKVQEFTTLCGVKMCMIIYGPPLEENAAAAPPEIWPADPAQVRLVIDEFNERKSRGTKTFTVQDYFALRRRKVDDEISKLRKSNTAARFSPRWDDRFKNLSIAQIKALMAKLDSILETAKKRMAILKANSHVLDPDIHAGLNLGFDVYTEKFSFSNQEILGSHPLMLSNHNEELISQQQHMLNPFDHMLLQPPCWPFNPIPASNPMMILAMNNMDFTQLGSASSSNAAYSPFSLPAGYDPASSITGSAAFNELTPVPAPGRYYGPSMLPLTVERQPSAMVSITSQLQISQLSEFCREMNEYEPRNKRHRFC